MAKAYILTSTGGEQLTVLTRTIVAVIITGSNFLLYRNNQEPLEIVPSSPTIFNDAKDLIELSDQNQAPLLVNYNYINSIQNAGNNLSKILFDCVNFPSIIVEQAQADILALIDNKENNPNSVPKTVGELGIFATEALPDKWMVCDGAELEIADYPALHDAIGFAFSPAPSATVFNIPDYRGRVFMGSGTGVDLSNRTVGELLGSEGITLTGTMIPEHTHKLKAYQGVGGTSQPATALLSTADAGSKDFIQGQTPNVDMDTESISSEFGNGANPLNKVNVIQPSLVGIIAIYTGVIQ